MSISPLAKRGFTLSTLSAACLMAFNAQAADCSNLEEWTAQGVFTGGTQVQFEGSAYQANWWTQNNNPAERSGSWQEWKLLGQCEGVIPTVEPTAEPTPVPTAEPTPVPTAEPTPVPTAEPTPVPTAEPTPVPTAEPTPVPTAEPTPVPTAEPTPVPTAEPTPVPTAEPTPVPTAEPTPVPTTEPTLPPTADNCKPAGLYQTPGVNTPYCTVYDADGREDMGADHPRRIIGYFTSWRNGANGQPSFLASDVPWDSLTHINYAFAHINKQGEVSVGDVNDPNNPATGMTWEGAENAMDPSLPYKGHFNLLNQYAKKHDVKLLLSVGGWAETGAHFDDKGRYMDGGFYSLTIKPDGSINHEAIAKFAKSAAKFVETYDFDGIDIDYEYPSSMSDAGHPEDWAISNQHRGKLWGGYMALMEALRNELDKQGEKDAQHYLLTIASPSSGYLLRGFEGFQALKYLDYVNIMSYDLHGAWNHFVGHNAALYDNGVDNEIADAGIYSGNDAKYYNSQGYLNIDWSYKYFRTALAGGRINIGLPYYTRGWQQVQGGTNGYNGLAALANQKECYLGTGGNLGPDALSPKAGAPCGLGAQGIENLWYDLGPDGKEMFAGVNPIWHVENLKQGLPTPYVSIYGHDTSKPEGQAIGNYVEHYDDVAQASWLWNEDKGVFLSTENMKSYQAKVQYAIDQGAGGIMFWEMAGDYSTPEQNGLGHYYFGSTLTDKAYEMIKTAAPYGIEAGDENFPAATETVDVDVDLVGYLPKGEDNYPIQIALKLTNNSNVDLSGAKIAFNASPAVPMNAQISDTLKPYAVPAGPGITNLVDMYSGATWSVEKIATSGLTSGNAGGLSDDFHRFAVQLKADGWGSVEWKPGQTIDVALRIYMPMPVPTNFTFEVGGKTYGRTAEQPNVPVAGGDNGTTPTPSGEPTPAPSGEPTVPSDVTPFVPGTAVQNGAVVSYNGACYKAKNNPGAWETPAAGGNWFWDVVTCP